MKKAGKLYVMFTRKQDNHGGQNPHDSRGSLRTFWMVTMGTVRGEVEELQHWGRILVVAG